MKKEYVSLDMAVVMFDGADVITSSIASLDDMFTAQGGDNEGVDYWFDEMFK